MKKLKLEDLLNDKEIVIFPAIFYFADGTLDKKIDSSNTYSTSILYNTDKLLITHHYKPIIL